MYYISEQINRQNIPKVPTIFEEEGFIFVDVENADFVESQSPHKFKNLTHTTICDLFSDMVDIPNTSTLLDFLSSLLIFDPSIYTFLAMFSKTEN